MRGGLYRESYISKFVGLILLQTVHELTLSLVLLHENLFPKD